MPGEKWSQFTAANDPTPSEETVWLQDQGAGLDNVRGSWSQIMAALGIGPAAITDQTARANYEGGIPSRPKNLDDLGAAIENINTAAVNIVVFGDSTACDGDIADNRPWPWRLSDILNRYVQSAAPVGWVPAKAGVGPTCDTATGTASSQDFGNHACTITAAEYVEHTGYCDRVTVVYRQSPGSGTIEVRDGGAGGTLLGTINANGASAYSMMWTSDALTPGDHTIHLISGAAGTQIIAGMYFYRGNYDKGVRVWPAVKSGATSQTATNSTNGFAAEMIANVDPDLLLYATGINDYANYETWMTAMVEEFSPQVTKSEAIWIPYILPTADRFTKASADDGRGIAATYGLGVVDASVGIPDMSVAGSGLLRDTTHPSSAGNGRIAAHAAAVLAGDPIGNVLALADMGFERVGDSVVAQGGVSAYGGNVALVDLGGFGQGILFNLTTGFTNISGSGVIASGSRLIVAASEAATEAVIRSQANQVRLSDVKPSGAIAQNLPRNIAVGNLTNLVSGTVLVVAISLLKGDLISSISWVSRNTAGASITNQWSCLLGPSREVLAVSADGGSAAWGTNTVKTFEMGTPYKITADGVYHLGLNVTATTVPTLCGLANAASNLVQIAPMICATSSTAQTTPPSLGATMGAFSTLGTGTPYAFVS